MSNPLQLTAARKWVLERAAISSVRGGYGGPSVITSFQTGETTYGARSNVVQRCEANGWIDQNGKITEAGRTVLKGQQLEPRDALAKAGGQQP